MSTTFIDNKHHLDVIVGDGDTVVISRGCTLRVFDDVLLRFVKYRIEEQWLM